MSNFILVSGTLLTGTNSKSNPAILTVIDAEYKIVSGKTNEYHARNSPSASKASPNATKSAPFFLPSIYETTVSIAPYTSKINEIDLMMCSIEIKETRNSGMYPTDLRYRDFGKNDFIVCENAIKK